MLRHKPNLVLLIGLVVKRANFHTDRAAIILVEIRKIDLVFNIGHLAVIVFDWVVIKSSRGTIFFIGILELSPPSDSKTAGFSSPLRKEVK